ncbi:MAG: 23S rRNA (pseudouridine(1915)-N(3))-methyltransferase RlmH [Clostridia bacterium]|nr:23S rRNA (pseudouridine(1915)-N(3))-methyltransferase RlmH [Clostridia bacterium]
MNYVVLHMGEGKERYYKEAFDEYCKRMNSFGSLTSVPLKPWKTPGRELSADEIRLALEKEAEIFEEKLASPKLSKSYKIALCIEGKEMPSEALASLFDRVAGGGKNTVVFLIGSSWGLHERIKASCDLRLSFSPMTFPHSLFKVMLAEQIYRAAGILAGNQYHK